MQDQPYDSEGGASFEMCSLCGFEYGFDDSPLGEKFMFFLFCEWAKSVVDQPWPNESKLIFKLGDPSSNRAARLEVDTPQALGVLAFWESGDYAMEIIDLVTAQPILMESGEFKKGQSFSSAFLVFFEKLDLKSVE